MKTKVTLTTIFILTILTTLAWQANSAKGQVVTEGLVSYWTFDKADVTGETVKDVWGNNDGTIVSDPQIVQGEVGEALELDGIDDYVEAPDDESLRLWNSYTLEAWIYQKEEKSSRIIDKITAGTADGLHLDTHPGRRLRTCAGNCVSGDTDYTLNSWHHVAVTFDNGDVKLYLDGTQDGSGNVPSPLVGNNLPLRIGFCAGGPCTTEYFSGIVDEVRIYNRALNDDEIIQNMDAEGLAVATSDKKLALTWGKIKVSS